MDIMRERERERERKEKRQQFKLSFVIKKKKSSKLAYLISFTYRFKI